MTALKSGRPDEAPGRSLIMGLDLRTLVIVGSVVVGAFGAGYATNAQIGALDDKVTILSDKVAELDRATTAATALTNARVTVLETAHTSDVGVDADRRVKLAEQLASLSAQVSGVQSDVRNVQKILELGPDALHAVPGKRP
jgi:hypothetical protein